MIDFNKAIKNINFLLKTEGKESALNYIEDLLIEYPNSSGILKQKNNIKYKMGQLDEAIEIYLYVIQNNNGITKTFAMRELFMIYIEQNNIEEATKLFDAMSNTNIDKEIYSALRAVLYRTQGKYAEASQIMLDVIKKANCSGETYLLDFCLTEVFRNYTDDFRRINYDIIKKAIQLVYNSVNGKSKAKMNLNLASLEHAIGNYQESINIYRSVNYKQDWIRGNVLIGICKNYLFMNNPDLLNSVEFEGLKAFTFIDAQHLIVQIYIAHNRFEEALEIIEKHSQNLRMLNEKAKIYKIMGKIEEALNLFMYCHEQSKEAYIIFKATTLFSSLSMLLELNRLEEALNILLSNQNILKAININMYHQIYAYLCTRLDIDYDKSQYCSYSVNQILNYNFEDACKHVEKHVEEVKELMEYDGDARTLMDYLSGKLINKVNMYSTLFDVYDVKCVGRTDDFYIRCIVIPNTKNILTFFPLNIIKLMDDDEIIEEKPKEKVIKRKSQMDKFKEKYNM